MSTRGHWRGHRVALLMGGPSQESAVSRSTGAAIERALRSRGYDPVVIDPGADLPAQLVACGAEVVFNALHGTLAEDGRLQGLLDWMRLPYTGDGVRASCLAFDKVLAKMAFRAAGVPVAPDVVWTAAEAARHAVVDLPFPLPVVVKPVAQGSSVGTTLVFEADAFGPALEAAAACGDVLIEQLVAGPELSVVSFGDDVLGSVEIEPTRTFYDYEAKYGTAGTRYHLPPRLAAADVARVEAMGLAAHRALGCRGATRTDVMFGGGQPIVLEVNTLPGMTATSLVPKVAAAAGVPFEELVERILDAAAFGPEGQR